MNTKPQLHLDINFSPSGIKIWILISIVFFMNASSHAQLNLATNAQSKYRIVVADEADHYEKKAASVLQKYLQEISAANLSVVTDDQAATPYEICIGKTNRTSTKENFVTDGFIIKTNGNKLYIYGRLGHATLYGVYHFLEKYLGCRKFTPILKYVPKLSTIKLTSINDLQNPQFSFRQVYYPGQYDEEFREWHKLQLLEDYWGLWGHTFDKLLPPSVYFKSHPEYYALVNGERKATQLCLSNANVYQILVKELAKQIDAQPEKKIWSVSQNDGFGYCTCALCAAIDSKYGGPQGSIINFVNKVARQFPAYTISTLAYLYSKHPPKYIKPLNNVSIMLSSIDVDRAKPIASNPRAASFRNDLVGWATLTNQLMVWDYVVQFTNYVSPFPNLTTLQPNLNYFGKNNVSGAFIQGTENTTGEFAALKAYLLAKLSWDPKADITKAKAEFMTSYYGKATPFINQYIVQIEQELQKSGRILDIYGTPAAEWNTWLRPDQIDQYSNLLEKAAASVETQPNFLKRVQLETLPLEFAVLQQARFYGIEKHGLFQVDEDGNWTVRSNIEKKITNFIELSKNSNLTTLQEDGFTVDNYAQEWNKVIKMGPILHAGINSKLTALTPFDTEYPAKGIHTLTDGTYGYNNFQYNYLGWFGNDMEVLIDLGKSKILDSLSIGFLEDQRHWAFLPSHISIELSNDKQNFIKAAEMNIGAPEENYEKETHRLKIKLNTNQGFRYIKVKAKTLGKLPEWRDLPNRKTWIFCDEIAIFEKQ
jgi:hypothetical protein